MIKCPPFCISSSILIYNCRLKCSFFFVFAAIWLAHITVDGEFREIVIFKNEACSRQTQKHCVLYTHQNDEEDYLLIGKVKFFGFLTYNEFKKGCPLTLNYKIRDTTCLIRITQGLIANIVLSRRYYYSEFRSS